MGQQPGLEQDVAADGGAPQPVGRGSSPAILLRSVAAMTTTDRRVTVRKRSSVADASVRPAPGALGGARHRTGTNRAVRRSGAPRPPAAWRRRRPTAAPAVPARRGRGRAGRLGAATLSSAMRASGPRRRADGAPAVSTVQAVKAIATSVPYPGV